MPAALAISRCRPGARIVGAVQVALRVTVDPVEVAYTSSRPARSTASEPPLYSSANSSEAEAPPVWTSDTTRVETGHVTLAASGSTMGPASGCDASGRCADAAASGAARRARTRATGRANGPARRARNIDDLPAG